MNLGRARLALLLLGACSLAACGDDDATPVDAGADATPDDGGRDAALPPGPRGTILGVPESANFVLPTLRGDVEVVRTEADVPHIYASNMRDLYVAQGFVVARDRYVEIELGRRLGLGELSALLGDRLLAQDQTSRGQGMREVVDRLLSQLTPEQEEMFDAFAEGMNAYTDAVRARRLPPPSELSVAALAFGLRSPADLMQPVDRRGIAGFLAVFVYQLGFDPSDVTRDSIDKGLPTFAGDPFEALRRDGVRRDIWENVRPIHPTTSAPAFGTEMGTRMARFAPLRRRRARRSRAVRPESEMLARLIQHNDSLEQLLHGGRGADFGSNAWAVSSRGTADGSTLLAADGHLPISVPTVFYQMGLDTTVFGDPAAGGDYDVLGLFFPGLPQLAVGTNGHVAWSQTYLEGDITDWYAEELRLDASGAPDASMFGGTWHPLVRSDESYVIANVPALGSVGRTETWARHSTFDGRRIASIEGRVVLPGATAGPGETVVDVQGVRVIPGDTDGDGHVSAVSFDFTGLDVSNLLTANMGFNRAANVAEFREHTRRFVAYAQNLAAADSSGAVLYTSYHAMPCRGYLPRDASGHWATGANPQMLLDGTRYGGFTVPLDAAGMPDETLGTTDPYKCIVPFDRWPTSVDPDRGYVLTSNNDFGGISLDNNLSNDEYYLGGPWAPGYRADTIDQRLRTLTAARAANVDEMARLQADHRSRLADEVGPYLFESIDAAKAALALPGPLGADDQRLADAYTSERAAIDEAQMRLQAWIARGSVAESGVETFYDTPNADQKRDAVATMIWNAWVRAFFVRVFDDEGVDDVWSLDTRGTRSRALIGIVLGRGAGNPRSLGSWNPATEESIFFDARGTAPVERGHEMAVLALADALAGLRAPPTEEGVGGFGTSDMSAWLWGLRHQLKLESLIGQYGSGDPMIALLTAGFTISPSRIALAPGLPDGDPRKTAPWFPRPGDLFAVDAANWPFTRPDYFYAYGPLMRMVISLSPTGVTGQNVIPGGQSGLSASPHFDDQAQLWLGNRALPLRFAPDAVAAGAIAREHLHP